MTTECDNCYEPIRPADVSKGDLDPHYEWVHEGGNPYCDWSPTATPKAAGVVRVDTRNPDPATVERVASLLYDPDPAPGGPVGWDWVEALNRARAVIAAIAPDEETP